MSLDRTENITHIELACDVCALQPRPGGAPAVRGARWAVALKDCCAAGRLRAIAAAVDATKTAGASRV